MSMLKKPWFIILAVLILLGIWFGSFILGTYNKMVSGNEGVNVKWAQVEAQYQRRFDLIPGLVESVKGAMTQEQKVFSDIAEARTKYAGAQGVDEKAAAASQVESAFGRLLLVMENYPQLKSLDTVQVLMSQLEGTENRISVERGRYNEVVATFNAMIKRIPANMIANWFGFEARNYFEAESGSEKAVKVDLKL